VDDLLDRYRLLLIIFFILAYFSRTMVVASAKPFWHDEIYTILMSNLPSVSAIWTASLDGADLSPPLNTWLTRVVHRTIGGGHVTTRLPAMLGFLAMTLIVFHLVRQRANATSAVAAMFLPCFTAAYRYSYEARGYGLMVGLFALSLFAWSEAARGERRNVHLPVLALALAAGMWTHYYAVLAFVVLGIGELVRVIQNRRPDWGVWIAIGVALVATIPLRPLMAVASEQAAHFWADSRAVDVSGIYAFVFAPLGDTVFAGTAIVAAICLVGAYVLRSSRTTPSETRRLPGHEAAAGVACLLIPIVSLWLGELITGIVVPRYALPAVVGGALVLPIAVHSLNRYRSPAELVLAVVLVWVFTQAAVQSLWWRPTRQDPVQFRTVLLTALRSPGPTAIGSSIHFLQFWYYAPVELKPRMTYLVDPAAAIRYRKSDTIDRGYAALARWTALPVEPFERFSTLHRSFKVYTDGSGWLLDKVADDGVEIQEIGREHGSQLVIVRQREGRGTALRTVRIRRRACHFQPVQFLFDLMERIVADLVVGTHVENSLSSRFERATMQFAMCGAHRICLSIHSGVCQMRRELLPDGVRDRRIIIQARDCGLERSFTRRTHLASDGILVMQIERA
jgi:Dolichyl-phosphate-mannose-protein mannosyltransferase